MLKRSEVFVHGVKKKNREYVILIEETHNGDLLIVCSQFGECVADRTFIRKFNLESLEKKVDLSERALLFMLRLEFLEHEVGGRECFNEMYVGARYCTCV